VITTQIFINSEIYEYRNASLDSYAFSEENAPLKPLLEQYADRTYSMKKGANLILWSPGNGRGKNYLVAAILKTVRKFDQPFWRREDDQIMPCGSVKTVAINFTPLIRTLKGFSDEDKRYQELLYTCDYLAINEMATSKNYSDDDELLDLFDTRLSNFKPFLITTNYSPEEFRKVFGERIFSKLQSRTNTWKVLGDDMRPIIKLLND